MSESNLYNYYFLLKDPIPQSELSESLGLYKSIMSTYLDSFRTGGDLLDFNAVNTRDPLDLLKYPVFPQKTNYNNDQLTSGQIKIGISVDSTDTDAINQINEEFALRLKARSKYFIISLKMADFEDGMTNELSDEVEQYLAHNKYPTYAWLNSLYSQNQTDYEVIAGLLRIINLTIDTSDSNYLLPIVKCGLNDRNIEAQEAAIMVVERWRTKECLDALQTAHFSSPWIKEYADNIISELIKELGC